MITLHIGEDIKQSVIANVSNNIPAGTLVFDEDDPLFRAGSNDKYHITTYSSGGSRIGGSGRRSTQAFDVEVRGEQASTSKHIIEKVAEYMQDSYTGMCTLPVVTGKSNRLYTKCQITNIGNITNLGKDSEDKMVFRINAQISYNK